MMNPFLLSPEQRILKWRELRHNLWILPEDKQLEEIAKWWAQCPIATGMMIDPDNPKSWPTPWELLSTNTWCSTSIAYLMELSLLVDNKSWTPERVQLIFVNDLKIPDQLMLVLIDEKHILNYSVGQISIATEVLNRSIVMSRYKWDGNTHLTL